MNTYQEIQNTIKDMEKLLTKVNTIKRGRNFWKITF